MTNVVVVMNDTLRRGHVAADRLPAPWARPTIATSHSSTRRTSTAWQPIEPGDIVLSEIVRGHGFLPMLIYDTAMLGNDSYDCSRGVVVVDFLRGHDLQGRPSGPYGESSGRS